MLTVLNSTSAGYVDINLMNTLLRMDDNDVTSDACLCLSLLKPSPLVLEERQLRPLNHILSNLIGADPTYSLDARHGGGAGGCGIDRQQLIVTLLALSASKQARERHAALSKQTDPPIAS